MRIRAQRAVAALYRSKREVICFLFSMELKRVVVTDLSALTPIGNNTAETWESLQKGVSNAEPITQFDASKFKTQFACEVKGFDPLQYFDRKEVRKYDQ